MSSISWRTCTFNLSAQLPRNQNLWSFWCRSPVPVQAAMCVCGGLVGLGALEVNGRSLWPQRVIMDTNTTHGGHADLSFTSNAPKPTKSPHTHIAACTGTGLRHQNDHKFRFRGSYAPKFNVHVRHDVLDKSTLLRFVRMLLFYFRNLT